MAICRGRDISENETMASPCGSLYAGETLKIGGRIDEQETHRPLTNVAGVAKRSSVQYRHY